MYYICITIIVYLYGNQNLKQLEIMKKYINTVVINGVTYTNTVEAKNYKEALAIQRERKIKSKYIYKGHLTLTN